MIAIDLSKQQELDTDPKAIQQINFTGNLDRGVTIFFVNKEEKETSKRNLLHWIVKVLQI